MTDSSRPHNRYARSFPAMRSLLVSLTIAASALIVLAGLLTTMLQPAGALAAPPSEPPARSFDAKPASAALFAPPSAPMLQDSGPTTFTLSILSTPFATTDSNSPLSGPVVWVVEAVITNTGSTTATAPVVDLDMNPNERWFLLPGESPQRNLPPLAPGSNQAVYWFARRSNTVNDPHSYTVAVWANNANTVTQQLNAFPPFSPTVQTQGTNSVGLTDQLNASANVQVGVAFTMSVDWDMGGNPQGVTLQPTGDPGFDAASYRLLSTKAQFRDGSGTPLVPLFRSRLYFPPGSLPAGARQVRTTFTFVALRPGNVTLCPYIDVRFPGQNFYDNDYCLGNGVVPITGTLTFSFTKSVNATTVAQGELLTYTLRYTNAGDLPISNVYVWDNIPTQTITASVSPAPDSTPGLNTQDRVVWN